MGSPFYMTTGGIKTANSQHMQAILIPNEANKHKNNKTNDRHPLNRPYCGDIPRDQRSNPDPDVEPPERALALDAEACLACSTVKIYRARIPGCDHWWCRHCLRQRTKQAVTRRKDESLSLPAAAPRASSSTDSSAGSATEIYGITTPP
jgi:hypothetical protein